MSTLARAETSHYSRLDAAYQRSLDDSAEREAAIEREVSRIRMIPIGAFDEDEIIDAMWDLAERYVDERSAEDLT